MKTKTKNKNKMSTNNDIKVGDKVTVTEEGMNAVVVKIHADGDFSVRFDDGEEGSYSVAEVEKL